MWGLLVVFWANMLNFFFLLIYEDYRNITRDWNQTVGDMT